MTDVVNNPEHYNQGDIECIDSIEAMLSTEEYIGYLRGNSQKYRWRFRYKNNWSKGGGKTLLSRFNELVPPLLWFVRGEAIQDLSPCKISGF